MIIHASELGPDGAPLPDNMQAWELWAGQRKRLFALNHGFLVHRAPLRNTCRPAATACCYLVAMVLDMRGEAAIRYCRARPAAMLYLLCRSWGCKRTTTCVWAKRGSSPAAGRVSGICGCAACSWRLPHRPACLNAPTRSAVCSLFADIRERADSLNVGFRFSRWQGPTFDLSCLRRHAGVITSEATLCDMWDEYVAAPLWRKAEKAAPGSSGSGSSSWATAASQTLQRQEHLLLPAAAFVCAIAAAALLYRRHQAAY